MNTPEIKTERLILRRFTKDDIKPIFDIYSDEKTNIFLPWFPIKTLKEAEKLYFERYELKYSEKSGYNYAVCLKEDNIPIGYINVGKGDSFDLGYGLLPAFWNRGIITEGAKAVIEQLKRDGFHYITATHDVNNPGSGRVMQKLSMKYMYSYEEQWQPKNIKVTFRLYQLSLDGKELKPYRKYWEKSAVHFIENVK